MELPINTIVLFIIALIVLLLLVYFFYIINQKTVPPIIRSTNNTGSELANETSKIICMTKLETYGNIYRQNFSFYCIHCYGKKSFSS